ncbi:uncharacterized protein V1516DRAFT_673352 [Lipomyces oligophaga]|uniref:uncharacterized protein n=1 Tax=Lipomyces oligophaga TaxID=45792 RepID=UPI0034CE328A
MQYPYRQTGASSTTSTSSHEISQPGRTELRTVIMSNLPPDEQIDLALLHSLVRGGKIEYSHYDPSRQTFFIHFMQARDASNYLTWIKKQGKVYLNDYEVYFDLVQSPAVVPPLFLSQSKVSRKIFLGGLPAEINARGLCAMFERYGVIEYVKIVWDRKCGWVSFCRIADAFDALRFINMDFPITRSVRIAYGKDDCEGKLREILEGGGVSINARKDTDIIVGKYKHMGRRITGLPVSVLSGTLVESPSPSESDDPDIDELKPE